MAEPDLLLDTDVLIEILRGRPEAATWLAHMEQQIIGLPVLVRMEVVQGARNQREQRQIIQQLQQYPWIPLEQPDSERALTWFETYYLSHNVSIMDCLIASSAVRRRLPLYTFNIKHYRVLPELDVRAPYTR